MKRAIFIWLLPLLSSCSEITQQKQLHLARAYGQSVLNAYAAQPSGRQVTETKTADLSCEQVTGKSLPKSIMECKVKVWGQQAVAEVSYLANPADDLSWKQTRVGQMRGLASDAELQQFGRDMAREYVAWTETAEFAAWVKARPFENNSGFGFGYSQECHEFSRRSLPAGVVGCIQGPGPGDGPTITLTLADGRYFMFDAY